MEEMRANNMTWERFYLLKELEKWLISLMNERSKCMNCVRPQYSNAKACESPAAVSRMHIRFLLMRSTFCVNQW